MTKVITRGQFACSVRVLVGEEELLELQYRVIVAFGDEMGVPVERDHDGGMPQLLADELQVCPFIDENRCVGVPEIVKAKVAVDSGRA